MQLSGKARSLTTPQWSRAISGRESSVFDSLSNRSRMTAYSEVMLPPLRRALCDFRVDFCDLIVSMEHAEISPRPVVGAIVVVSGLAVSFLLWLLYVHHASTDFAGRWMFLPALNALLNGLCAIALCVGLYFRENTRPVLCLFHCKTGRSR